MIRAIGGYNSPPLASVILRDDSGHIVEVVARLALGECGWGITLEVRDLGMGVPAPGHPDPEFATQHDYQVEATT